MQRSVRYGIYFTILTISIATLVGYANNLPTAQVIARSLIATAIVLVGMIVCSYIIRKYLPEIRSARLRRPQESPQKTGSVVDIVVDDHSADNKDRPSDDIAPTDTLNTEQNENTNQRASFPSTTAYQTYKRLRPTDRPPALRKNTGEQSDTFNHHNHRDNNETLPTYIRESMQRPQVVADIIHDMIKHS